MSGTTTDRLYRLLPAVYRLRDADRGEPLRALLGVMDLEMQRIEADIDQLYDDWFVETCQEWVLPYIGDLVGVRNLGAIDPKSFSLRAMVANTIALRRRKGTLAALEQMARDVTGWDARVVEYFQLLSTSQHIDRPRPGNVRTPDIRDLDTMDYLGGPFERAPHLLDVRGFDYGAGRFNVPNLGLFLWRLQPWPVTEAAPTAGTDGETGLYRFSQTGRDLRLYNFPQARSELGDRAEEHHLPVALRPRALEKDLEDLRNAIADGDADVSNYFGAQPVFRIDASINAGAAAAIEPHRIAIIDLSSWPLSYDIGALPNETGQTFQVGVDPVLGRFAFATGLTVTNLRISYYYAFSGEVGGGEYDRRDVLEDREGFATVSVSGGGGALTTALSAWAAAPSDTIIEIQDSAVYTLSGGPLTLTVGTELRLEIRAANRTRPTIRLAGLWTVTLEAEAGLTLNGLVIDNASIDVHKASNTSLALIHCTVVPTTLTGSYNVIDVSNVAGDVVGTTVCLERCITGPLRLDEDSADSRLRIHECIIDGQDATSAITHTGVATLEASTVLGSSAFNVLELASDSIFYDVVTVSRRQQGCVRFSYAESETLPLRYESEPEPAATDDPDAYVLRVRPRFTSLVYGEPGYCQLRSDTADEVREGASDEGEMGVFNHLQQTHRESNLRTSLDAEDGRMYPRIGFEAGIIYVS